MTKQNRELMQRALGQIEGVSLVAEEKIRSALFCAVDILECILDSETKPEKKNGK